MAIKEIVESILTHQIGLFILGCSLTLVPMFGIMIITEKAKHDKDNNE
jgi:hypothetical protein